MQLGRLSIARSGVSVGYVSPCSYSRRHNWYPNLACIMIHVYLQLSSTAIQTRQRSVMIIKRNLDHFKLSIFHGIIAGYLCQSLVHRRHSIKATVTLVGLGVHERGLGLAERALLGDADSSYDIIASEPYIQLLLVDKISEARKLT
jgi:hypothetical protein